MHNDSLKKKKKRRERERDHAHVNVLIRILKTGEPQCFAYLAFEGFHFTVLNTGSSFAYIHGVVKEGLIFS